jgi:hypothetical protein
MKKNVAVFIGLFLFICLCFTTCSLEGESENETPVIQEYLTVTGLDAFDGNYVVFYGIITWEAGFGPVYDTIGCNTIRGNPTSNNFSLNGVEISGGRARIPIYAISRYEDNWGVFNGILTEPIEFIHDAKYSYTWELTFYINKKDVVEYVYGYSLGDTVAAGVTQIGLIERSKEWTVDKSEFEKWFEW